jgi:cytochrome c biogenesis protein
VPGYGTIRGVDYDRNYRGEGPALKVVVDRPGKPSADLWLVQGKPVREPSGGDSPLFSFDGLATRMFTGLQVARDPGVNVVWLGCALMVIGIVMAFFMSHQRVWLRLAPGADGRVTVALAGSANRNRLAFEKKFERIVSGVKAVES